MYTTFQIYHKMTPIGTTHTYIISYHGAKETENTYTQ